MTLIELQNVLGDRINLTLNSDDLSSEDRQIQNEDTQLLVNIAKQMINNGDLILRTEKLLAQQHNLRKSYAYTLINGTAGDDEINRAS